MILCKTLEIISRALKIERVENIPPFKKDSNNYIFNRRTETVVEVLPFLKICGKRI